MQQPQLHELARSVADQLPASHWGQPFGPDSEVYKVKHKVFIILTEIVTGPIVVVKVEPADAAALRLQYPEITPGYHMNKRHWISLAAGITAYPGLIGELVTDSYRLVVAGLPRALRPIDPETFGTHQQS